MTRINTNVSSLVSQITLGRNTGDLQQALTRLSTGLRINTGKDDPAGLIASEALRSDITSIDKAISNSERANQVIATADSALGQVSSLLNDIRGLVVEAANTGAMSDDQIAANQLQVDSSLEAINRIAQTTTWQGSRLLDGSLDFMSTIATVATVRDSIIEQANLGSTGQVSVDVDITTAATKATVTNTGGVSAATNATATVSFAAGATFQNADTDTNFYIDAAALGTAESGVVISFADGGAGATTTATYTAGATLVISYDAAAGITADDVVTAINNQVTEFNARTDNAAGAIDAGDAGTTTATTGVDSLQLDAVNTGSDYNGVAIDIVATTGATSAAWDADQKTVTISVNNAAPVLLSAIETAVDTDLAGVFTSTATASGSTYIDATGIDTTATGNTDNSGGNVLNADLVVSIGGSTGREVFNFQAGASINAIASAVNLVSDAVGVGASTSSGTLTLESTQYGSSAFVDVDVISEGTGGTFENGLSAIRDEGDDIVASVNGIGADGDGNTLKINTSTLDLEITVDEGSNTNFVFEITGGGALFQLGPDVVTTQQARLGIQSLNTAELGSENGRLYELASGGSMALSTDPNSAFRVVDRVINKIAMLRGRLGAFQRATLETNVASLSDTLVNLTEAESEIRDADFAKESSALTRAQILVQSGTQVLSIANSNPQNVLSLLR